VNVTNISQEAPPLSNIVDCLPSSDSSKGDSVPSSVTSPSVSVRPSYATVVSSPRRDGPQEVQDDDDNQTTTDMSCFGK